MKASACPEMELFIAEAFMFTLKPARLLERVDSHAFTVCVPPEVMGSVVYAVRLSKVDTVVPVYLAVEMVIRSTFPTTVVTVKLSVVAANRPKVVMTNISASSSFFFISIPIGSVSFRASFVPFSEVQPYDSNLRDLCQYQLVIFHL